MNLSPHCPRPYTKPGHGSPPLSTSPLGSRLLRGVRELVFSVLWGLKSPLCKCGEKTARRHWKQPSFVASSKTCLSSRGLLDHCYFVLILWENIINLFCRLESWTVSAQVWPPCFLTIVQCPYESFRVPEDTASWRLSSILLAVLQETSQTWNSLAWGWNLLPASWTLVTISEPAPCAPTEHTLNSYAQSWQLLV